MNKNINDDIKTGNFKNLYLLFGQERFLVSYYAKTIEELGFEKDTFDGAAPVHDIMMAASTLPFFSQKRLIYVRDSKLFAPGRKNDSEAMAEFLPQIPADTIMVFIETDVDRRSRMYKKTAELGRAVDCEPPSPNALTSWVSRFTKDKGKSIAPANVNLLMRTVGSDMTTISQEIEKLTAYCGNEPEILPAHIEAICTPTLESRIFDLIKAMGNGRTSQALSLYGNMLRLKESPLMILSMIIRQFRLLLLVKCGAAKKMPRQEIAKELNLRDFMVTESMEQGRRFTQEQLLQALTDCQDVDVKIKTGLVAAEVGVEMLIVKYSVS